MTKHERGTKSPTTLRRTLPIAVVLVVAVLFITPVAAVDFTPSGTYATATELATAINSTAASTVTVGTDEKTITLANDITVKGQITLLLENDIIIDGNGHTIFNELTTGSIFDVTSKDGVAHTFTLGDGTDALTINGQSKSVEKSPIAVNGTGTTFIMKDKVKIINHKMNAGTRTHADPDDLTSRAIRHGGAVQVVHGAEFIMDGGEISGNVISAAGGAVYINCCGSNAIFTMNGGKITSNKAYQGGGIYVGSKTDGTIILNNGEISGNTATNYGGGGGICIQSTDGKLMMNGGTISGNEVTYVTGGTPYGTGGGIYSYGSIDITAGEISGNTANYAGAGIYTGAGTYGSLTISGGKITNNIAKIYGGGIYGSGESVTISGSTEITGNSAAVGGGLVNTGTLTLAGGTISGNSATQVGGALMNWGGVEITSGVISTNSAQAGGGIYNDEGTIDMSGGEISGDNSAQQGGGIYNGGGSITLSGTGKITGNSADQVGGAIMNYGNIEISGGEIKGNTADQVGGGIYDFGTFSPQDGITYISQITVSETAHVSENTVNNAANNIYLAENPIIISAPLKEGAKIGVTVNTIPSTIATSETDYSEYFSADDTEKYHIEYDSTNKKIILAEEWTKYTVTWKVDGKDDKTEQVKYGTVPAYGETPTKDTTKQYSYTFKAWKNEDGEEFTADAMPEVKADETYTAVFTETFNTYTVTWKNHDGALLGTDEKVTYGTIPTYNKAVPTKSADEKYTYVFSSWIPELSPVTTDITYEATFVAIEKPVTPPSGGTSAPAPVQPVLPIQVTQPDASKGETETTIVTTAGDETLKVLDDKTKVEITPANEGTATITVQFDSEVAAAPGAADVVKGDVQAVTIAYTLTHAEPVSEEEISNPIQYQMTIGVDTVVKDLPKIDSTVNDIAVNTLETAHPNLKPVVMITATNANEINQALQTGGTITIVFTLPNDWLNSMGKLWSFHVRNGNVEDVKEINRETAIRDLHNGYSEVTISGTSFSTHGIAGEEKQTPPPPGGDSYTPQGSSVWLTESQTPTPTETPSEQPTDVAPTDVPTTQPTATETQTPGFGVLAVLAGLGAVAVLRRK